MRRLCLALLALPLSAQETKTVTTPTGLKLEMLAEGKPGTAPKPGDRVKVHYTGWLADGTKFDSSVGGPQPAEFVLGVGVVIEGWDEAIALMDVGSKWKLSVRAALGHGADGLATAKIPPDADLLYEVELLDVVKGRPVPGFRPAEPAKQKTTESGLKWEELEEGNGDVLLGRDVVELRCTIWTPEGKIAFCSDALGMPITGEAGTARLTRVGEKFLPEALLLMKPGGKYRVEVPAALCWGETKVLPRLAPNTPTVWQIDVLKTIRFVPLDPARTKKTGSGLEYEVLEEGTGAMPGPTSKVVVHYTGWLENGTEFHSSHRRAQYESFALNQVIKGWTEGLQLMKEGAIYRFRIPAALAYGAQAKGDLIPANSTLIFEVEMLRVQ